MEAPQIVVISIIRDKDKFLLVKRAREPFENYWSLVGGLSVMKERYSSDPLEASKDEVNCDLNCEFVNPKFFTYSFSEEEKPTICLYFYGQIKGNITINPKYISEYKWFSIDEIKDLELAFGHKEMLLRFFKEIN
jgi:ADP-ribose pyrophosphatase YjhB (NUDIX family)